MFYGFDGGGGDMELQFCAREVLMYIHTTDKGWDFSFARATSTPTTSRGIPARLFLNVLALQPRRSKMVSLSWSCLEFSAAVNLHGIHSYNVLLFCCTVVQEQQEDVPLTSRAT